MPSFMDESGDTGPIRDGGKPYFRLAVVWVPTHEDAEDFRAKVRQLRRDLGLRPDYEFKFAETHNQPGRRHAFYSVALSQEFRFAVSSIDKTDEYWASAARHEQHWACATELAVVMRPIYHSAEERKGSPLREPIVVDDNRDGDFLATVKRQFRGLRSKLVAVHTPNSLYSVFVLL